MTADGITRIIPDEDRPIAPILDAYREAGTIRGACELLQRRGIPAPRGGKVWGTSTLARVLEHYVELPRTLPSGGTFKDGRWYRAGRRTPGAALFAGLLCCHCGRTMTPNLARGQYYCSAGRDSGSALHGKMSVTERALRAVLEPEAARYSPKIILTYRQHEQAARERIERAMERLDEKRDVRRVTLSQYQAQMAGYQAELAKLDSQGRTVDKLMLEPVPSWDDVPAMNKHLRRLWTSVVLDADMHPTVEWAIPRSQYDEEAAAEQDEHLRDLGRLS